MDRQSFESLIIALIMGAWLYAFSAMVLVYNFIDSAAAKRSEKLKEYSALEMLGFLHDTKNYNYLLGYQSIRFYFFLLLRNIEKNKFGNLEMKIRRLQLNVRLSVLTVILSIVMSIYVHQNYA